MQLVIALDMPTLEENLALLEGVKKLSSSIWVKIGLRTFIRDGVEALKAIKGFGAFKVFLDLKLYDIPNTMADAAFECARLGVDMITIHASAGKKAMNAVMQRLDSVPNRPLVMGVSALTSFDDEEFRAIYNMDITQGVRSLAQSAKEGGIDGMVCSVQESVMIKDLNGELFLSLTPGIRPFGESSDDQKRIATISDAKRAKSDFIVIGRPIYNAPNPQEAISAILREI